MLASVIRDIVAPVLTECPQECGIVSITSVEVSPDFSHATVYISALQEVETARSFLEEKRQFLQQDLGQLYRKRIPTLRFRIDSSIERGERIDALLDS